MHSTVSFPLPRIHNNTASGVVHTVDEEDGYNGYRIPKGALVLPNIWCVNYAHLQRRPGTIRTQENDARRRELQRPRRVQTRAVLERAWTRSREGPAGACVRLRAQVTLRPHCGVTPRKLIIRNRRICPGKDLTEQTLFITIATVIAVLDIAKAKVGGVDVEPDVTYNGGLIRWLFDSLVCNSSADMHCSHPSAFECAICARSEKAASLVAAVIEDHPVGSGDADELSRLVWQR